MARRVPLPWEAGRSVERVALRDPAEGHATDGPCGVPQAERLAALAAGDPDPQRARRGAAGAADAMYQEARARGWGLSRDDCRARVNTARSRAAAKKLR